MYTEFIQKNKNNISFRSSSVPFGWSLANLICFKKIRQNLGLDRCHFQMTGAAPSNEDTLAFFMSINLPLCEMYGMSETTGKGWTVKLVRDEP